MSNLRRIDPPTSQNVSDTEIFFTERMSLVPSDNPMLNRECTSSHANMLLILDNKLGASAHGYSDPIANRSPHDPLTASACRVSLPAPLGLALHAMSHDARRSAPPAAQQMYEGAVAALRRCSEELMMTFLCCCCGHGR